MNPLASIYFEMTPEQQKVVQVHLCKMALSVWEKAIPENVQYVESVAGTSQELDSTLPRDALESVLVGRDTANVGRRYLEPLAALQEESITLPDTARYAYYAIYNLFARHIEGEAVDAWLIPNQVLSAFSEAEVDAVFEGALRAGGPNHSRQARRP